MTAEEIAKEAVANIISDFPEVDKLMISEKELCKKIKELESAALERGFNAARDKTQDCIGRAEFVDGDCGYIMDDKYPTIMDYLKKEINNE